MEIFIDDTLLRISTGCNTVLLRLTWYVFFIKCTVTAIKCTERRVVTKLTYIAIQGQKNYLGLGRQSG